MAAGATRDEPGAPAEATPRVNGVSLLYRVTPVATPEQLGMLQRECRKVYVDPNLIQYAVKLVGATRRPDKHGLAELGKYLSYGASPRASIALIEAGDAYRTQHMEWLSWQRWLDTFSPHAPGKTAAPSPARWLYFNYAHQIVQAALTGQGVALARQPLVAESLANGDLVEVLPEMRLSSPLAYWLLVAPRSKLRPEVRAFCDWLRQQADNTRLATGDVADPETLASRFPPHDGDAHRSRSEARAAHGEYR